MRLLLAAVMALWGVWGSVEHPWELALVVFSLYPLVTGISGWDPIYVLLGYRGTKNRPGG